MDTLNLYGPLTVLLLLLAAFAVWLVRYGKQMSNDVKTEVTAQLAQRTADEDARQLGALRGLDQGQP